MYLEHRSFRIIGLMSNLKYSEICLDFLNHIDIIKTNLKIVGASMVLDTTTEDLWIVAKNKLMKKLTR